MADGRLPRERDVDMNAEPEGFLSRWSRLKRDAVQPTDAPQDATAAVTPAATAAASTQSAAADTHGAVSAAPDASAGKSVADPPAGVAEEFEELPPIESLDGLNSDYVAFFRQPVEESLRRAALKKLFSDPHFNVMDGLDIYIDDYTHFEPIPEPLRQQLIGSAGFLNRAMPEAEARERLSVDSTTAPAAPDDAAAAAEPADQIADQQDIQPDDRPPELQADLQTDLQTEAPQPDEPAVALNVDGQEGVSPAATADGKPPA